jgi:hypothetical protein
MIRDVYPASGFFSILDPRIKIKHWIPEPVAGVLDELI